MATKKYLFLVLSLVLLFSARPAFAVKPSDFGLKEGDLISAIFSDDPDVYIINEQGYKRLFLNPDIFKFYKHLGGFANIKLVTTEVRDSFPTSGLFRNCEAKDEKVYGIDIEGEDQGELRWVNTSGDQAVKDDPDFFKKVFCINKKEFDWYPKATTILHSVKEVPQYDRMEIRQAVSTEEKLKTNFGFKEEGKVLVCHSPAETASRSLEIFIASSAVKAHLEHGDKLGSCRIILPTFSPTPVPIDLVPVSTPLPPASGSIVILSPTPTSTSITTSTPAPAIASSSPSFSLPPGAVPIPTPTTSIAPPPPSYVSATSAGDRITISWAFAADKYRIFRSVLVNNVWSSWGILQWAQYYGVTNGPDNTYTDYGVVSGLQYRYRVYGCESSGQLCSTNGTDSNAVTFSASSFSSPPQSPSSVALSATIGKITASWPASAARYHVYISMNNEPYQSLYTGTTITFYDHLNVNAGTTYRFKIYGCHNNGWPYTCSATGTESNALIYGSSTPTPTPSSTSTSIVNSTPTPAPTPTPTPAPSTSLGPTATPTPTPTPAPTPTLPPNAPAGALLASDGSWCYTSDGDVYNTNGSVNPSYTSSGSCQDSAGGNWTDYCSRSNIVEFSCSGSSAPAGSGFVYSHINCSYTPGGETCPGSTPTCSSGVCIAQVPSTNINLAFPRHLFFGSSGPDVKQLQALLVNEVGYPAHLLTGYFGSITREAVKRLQEKYGVRPTSGYFGAITRKMLNAPISH